MSGGSRLLLLRPHQGPACWQANPRAGASKKIVGKAQTDTQDEPGAEDFTETGLMSHTIPEHDSGGDVIAAKISIAHPGQLFYQIGIASPEPGTSEGAALTQNRTVLEITSHPKRPIEIARVPMSSFRRQHFDSPVLFRSQEIAAEITDGLVKTIAVIPSSVPVSPDTSLYVVFEKDKAAELAEELAALQTSGTLDRPTGLPSGGKTGGAILVFTLVGIYITFLVPEKTAAQTRNGAGDSGPPPAS